MQRILHGVTSPFLPSLVTAPFNYWQLLKTPDSSDIYVLVPAWSFNTRPNNPFCEPVSHSPPMVVYIHQKWHFLQTSDPLDPTSPRPRGTSYSILDSEHPAQHIILHLAQQLCSINVDKTKLGLRSDLQVIKHEVGSKGITVKREPIKTIERYSWTIIS